MKYRFLREEGDSLIFDGQYMEVYIPQSYFEKRMAIQEGSFIRTLGIFGFRTMSKPGAKDGSDFRLNLPSPIRIGFTNITRKEIEEENDTPPPGDDLPDIEDEEAGFEEEDDRRFVILGLEKGDVFIQNLNVPQSAQAFWEFLQVLHGGKIPPSVPYGELLDMYRKSMNLNAVSFGMPSVVLEFILAEICRDAKDPTVPFRKRIGRPDARVSENDYIPMNIKRLADLNSVFTGITFENFNHAVISGVRKTKEGTPQAESPMEKTMKF